MQLYATKPNARSQTSQITLQNKTLLNISPISKKEQIGDRRKRKEESIKGRRNADGRPKTDSQKESKMKEVTLKKIISCLSLYHRNTEPLYHSFCIHLYHTSFWYLSITCNAFISCYVRCKKYQLFTFYHYDLISNKTFVTISS